MSDTSDLPRWATGDGEEEAAGLGRLLQAGRADVGSSQDVAELARRLSAVLGQAAGLPRGPEPAAGSGVAGRDAGPPASGPSLRGDVGGAVRSAGKLSSARWAAWAIAGAGAIAGSWWAIAVSSRDPGAPVPAVEAPAATPPLPVTEAHPPEPRLSETPAPEAGLAEPSNDVATRPPVRAVPPNRPRSVAAAARAGGEAALLERAQAALERRPAEALRLSRQHEARFPEGALVQEREVIAIDALRRLGREAAAKARAAEFERRFRGSVHQPRVWRATDTSATGGGGSATLPQ